MGRIRRRSATGWRCCCTPARSRSWLEGALIPLRTPARLWGGGGRAGEGGFGGGQMVDGLLDRLGLVGGDGPAPGDQQRPDVLHHLVAADVGVVGDRRLAASGDERA